MKDYWKGGNMLYPLPAVMISCGNMTNSNVFTVAWCGNCNTNPPMVYISVRKERFSYDILKENKEFVINLVNEELVKACDYAGVKSGKDHDKFSELQLTKLESKYVKAPSIAESPVNIECRVNKILELGSHDMFIADVLGTTIDTKYLDENNKFDLKKANLITYSHGEYFSLGEVLGTFGYSIRKKK